MAQKYVIVHFIDLAAVPDEFMASEWPLHITLLANFTLGQPLEAAMQKLEDYARRAKPFEAVADGEALFGHDAHVAVSLIRPSEDIRNMHQDLADRMTVLGAAYDEPAYMSEGYRPHATIRPDARLSDGQKVRLDAFTLVDMFPDGDIRRRRIIKTYKLGGPPVR